jgi:hypothetical protein
VRISILGHHPDLFPGFNSLMTSNLAYGFAALGHDVTVFLPNTRTHQQNERLTTLGFAARELDKFGSQFSIRIIEHGEKLGKFDLGVWQSYFANDEDFFPEFRRSARVISKNFPRLLTGDRERDIRVLAGTANRFDVIGLALRSDRMLADSMIDKVPDAVRRSIYMPRGFREDWFEAPNFSGVPVLGIEKGVDTDSHEYSYLIPVIERLRKEFGQVDVIGARLNDPAVTTSTLGLLSAREFYRRFLNPLWAYLMIDVNRSRQSMNAVTVDGKKVYPGLYENQVVEAQLAGAAVVGHEDALPAELVASGRTGLRFSDFGDTSAIFDFLAAVIQNRPYVAEEAKAWARANHSVENMVRPLLAALQ